MEQRVAELEALVRGVEDEFARACARQSTRLAAVEERLGRASAQVTPERRRDCQRPGVPLLGLDIHVDAHGRAALQIVPQLHGGRAGEDEEAHAHLVATINALRTELQAKDAVIQALRARTSGSAGSGGGAGRTEEEEEESDDEIDPDIEILAPRNSDADAGDEVRARAFSRVRAGNGALQCSLTDAQLFAQTERETHADTHRHTRTHPRCGDLVV